MKGQSILKIGIMQKTHISLLQGLERHSSEQKWTGDDYDEHISRHYCGGFVALDGTRIVGLLAYERISSLDDHIFPPVWQILGIVRSIGLLNLVVHRDYRRRGIGQKLIETLMEKEKSLCLVNVRDSNLDAQLFYKSLGFLAYGISKDYFTDYTERAPYCEDAICFRKNFAEPSDFPVQRFTIFDSVGNLLEKQVSQLTAQ